MIGMVAKKRPMSYWVMGSGEPINNRGYRSLIEARAFAIKKLRENRLYSVRTYGELDIVRSIDAPYRHKMNYHPVGIVSKNLDDPDVFYWYPADNSGKKIISVKGMILR